MVIIDKPSMSFNFVTVEVTWYPFSCKHEWFSLRYQERCLNLPFTVKQATFWPITTWMSFDFVIMELTWYFISCKHEWFSQIPWKVFNSPIHSKTGHILTNNNKNVHLNTYMVIINKPSMSFDFDIMEVTWHFMSCKHEWFSHEYHERFLSLPFTVKQAAFWKRKTWMLI